MVTLSGLNLELQCWWHQGSLSLGLWVCRQLDLEWSSDQLWQNLVVDHFTSWRKHSSPSVPHRPSHHGASSLSGVQKVFSLCLSLEKEELGECLNGRTFLVAVFSFMMLYLLKAVRRSMTAYLQGPPKIVLAWLVFGSCVGLQRKVWIPIGH